MMLRTPKCGWKISTTPLHHYTISTSLNLYKVGRRHPFMLFIPISNPTIEWIPVLSWQCGLLLLLLPICRIRGVFLHILVVTSGYLSYCVLLVILKQSGRCLLTSTRFSKTLFWSFFGLACLSCFCLVLGDCLPQKQLSCTYNDTHYRTGLLYTDSHIAQKDPKQIYSLQYSCTVYACVTYVIKYYLGFYLA